ncbi:MAG: hypothetical protein KDD48_01260 [Bdellovibrionales bacterium]|nr:hypothetical protein [Bdellovibrionales bacterium]
MTKYAHSKQGFTILEIFVGLLLLLILGSSFAFVRKKHQKLQTENQCEKNRWEWNTFFEDIQLRLNRWKMFAPQCLNFEFSPAILTDKSITVFDLTSFSKIEKNSPLNNEIYVLPGHQFVLGENLLICGQGGVQKAQIQSIQVGRLHSLIRLTMPEDTLPLFKGDLLVSTKANHFEARKETPEFQFLYQQLGEDQFKPLITNITSANFSFDPLFKKYRLTISKKQCVLESEFSIQGGLKSDGRWQIIGNELVFEPWKYGDERGAS